MSSSQQQLTPETSFSARRKRRNKNNKTSQNVSGTQTPTPNHRNQQATPTSSATMMVVSPSPSQIQHHAVSVEELFSACQTGDVETVLKASHSSGPNFLSSSRQRDSFSPLQQACHYKQLSVVKTILKEAEKEVADNHSNNDQATTTIHELLSHTTKSGGQTALLIAASVGALDIFKFLVEEYPQHYKNFISHEEDAHKNRSLLIAAREGFVDLVEYILSKVTEKSQIDAQNADRATAFSVAASNGSVDCAKLLLAAGANPSLGPVNPLLLACQNGRTELTKLIVADLQKRDKENFKIDDIRQRTGATCLMIAAQGGRTEIMDFLIDDAGADIFAKSNDGFSAIANAVFMNKPEAVKKLLEKCPVERREELMATKIKMNFNKSGDGETSLLEIAQQRNCGEVMKETLVKTTPSLAENNTHQTTKVNDGDDELLLLLQTTNNNYKKRIQELESELEEAKQKLGKSNEVPMMMMNQQQSLQDDNNRLQLRVEELENEISELRKIVLAASPSSSPVRNSSSSSSSSKEEIIQVMAELTAQLQRERETQSKLQNEVLNLKKKVQHENNTTTTILSSPPHHQRRGSLLVENNSIEDEKKITNTIPSPSAVVMTSPTSLSNHQQQQNNNGLLDRKELEETIYRLRKQAKENETQLEKEKSLRKREEKENQAKLESVKKETEELYFAVEIQKLKNERSTGSGAVSTTTMFVVVPLIAAGVGFGIAKFLGSNNKK